MSAPNQSFAAGWYPDPWEQASQRWYDGAQWTHHVQEPEAAAAAQPARSQLAEPPPLSLVPESARASAKPTTSSLSIWALVLGLIGIPLVPAFVGVSARREIEASGGALIGRGAAMVGIVLGALNTITLAIVLLVVVPMFFGSFGDSAQPEQGPVPVEPAEPADPSTVSS